MITKNKEKEHRLRLAELGAMIEVTRGTSSSGVTTTRNYSNINDQLRKAKLRELGRMIKG